MRKLLAALLTFATLTIASAQEVQPIVIDNDDGGQVDSFIMWYGRIYNSGVPVRVRGICVSACTLFLSLPKDQVCVEPTASLGFHLFSIHGQPHLGATQAYARRFYPAGIREWLKDKKLTSLMTFMSAEEAVATGDVRECDPPVAKQCAPVYMCNGTPETNADWCCNDPE